MSYFAVNLTRHQCRINGLTHINLTKLDVLSELETIQLGVGYKIDGKEISAVPSLIEDFERTEVLYETLPGWKQDISKVSPVFILLLHMTSMLISQPDSS